MRVVVNASMTSYPSYIQRLTPVAYHFVCTSELLSVLNKMQIAYRLLERMQRALPIFNVDCVSIFPNHEICGSWIYEVNKGYVLHDDLRDTAEEMHVCGECPRVVMVRGNIQFTDSEDGDITWETDPFSVANLRERFAAGEHLAFFGESSWVDFEALHKALGVV